MWCSARQIMFVIWIFSFILFYLYFRYEDSEDEPIDDEPVEFLEAEGRKRPKRPTNIKFNPFDDPLDFVPSFEPTNKFPIIIERNREVIDDVMDEEIDENDEDYGNMGSQVLKGGIQNSLDFWQKSTNSKDIIVFCQ